MVNIAPLATAVIIEDTLLARQIFQGVVAECERKREVLPSEAVALYFKNAKNEAIAALGRGDYLSALSKLDDMQESAYKWNAPLPSSYEALERHVYVAAMQIKANSAQQEINRGNVEMASMIHDTIEMYARSARLPRPLEVLAQRYQMRQLRMERI